MKTTVDRGGVKAHLLSSFLQSFKICVGMIPKETTKYLKESWNTAMGSPKKVICCRPEQGPGLRKGFKLTTEETLEDVNGTLGYFKQRSKSWIIRHHGHLNKLKQTLVWKLWLFFSSLPQKREREKGQNFMGERKWVMDAMSFKYLWDIQKRW